MFIKHAYIQEKPKANEFT